MSKFYIQTEQNTSVIIGDKMFIDGDRLYVYDDEDLIGVFRCEDVRAAYKTDCPKR